MTRRPTQRVLPLPGQGQRLSRDEVAAQAQLALEHLRTKEPRRRLDASLAPRRAFADVRVEDGWTPKPGSLNHDVGAADPARLTVQLVCGHELRLSTVPRPGAVFRCMDCLQEGRP